MTVYVDNMHAPFGRMIMCHMLADTSDELHTMADRIGVARKWCQSEGTRLEHYAVRYGAREITRKEAGDITLGKMRKR